MNSCLWPVVTGFFFFFLHSTALGAPSKSVQPCQEYFTGVLPPKALGNITSHHCDGQTNKNQNLSVDKDVGELQHSSMAGGNVEWLSSSEKQFGSFSVGSM